VRYETLDGLQPAEVELVSRLLDEEMGGRWQVRLAELIDVVTLPNVRSRTNSDLIPPVQLVRPSRMHAACSGSCAVSSVTWSDESETW
jgi:hypothetical protein